MAMNWKKIAVVVAAVGALNWGLAELNWSLLTLLGSNAMYAAWAIAAAGAYVLYEELK